MTITKTAVVLTREEAFTLFMAADNGQDWHYEASSPTDAAGRKAFERAMSKLARTFDFRDPHPKLRLPDGWNR